MNVDEAIRSRRSVARIEGDVDPATIRDLVELATWAPNHRLTEPWRFTVVRGTALERLGTLWGEINAKAAELAGDAYREAVQREAAKTARAPVLIVASCRGDADPVVAEEDFAATAAAVENMLLGARARGLGAMWRTGRMTRDPAVKAFLDLSESDRIVAIVYLGKTAVLEKPARAREVEGVLRWLEPT